MHITKIPENVQVMVIASIEKNYLEFSTKVIASKDDGLIIEAIKNENGQALSLVSDKIRFDISYVEQEDKPPFLWKDIKAKFVKIGNTPYHMLWQTSDGKRENRRAAFRLFIGEKAQLKLMSKAGNIPVILKNISTTGFAFVFQEELALNKFCTVSCVVDNSTLVLSGVIVRKQVMENGNIVYGCKMEKFSKELDRFIAKKQREAINNKLK